MSEHTASMERVDWGGAFLGAISLRALGRKERRVLATVALVGGFVGLISMLGAALQEQVENMIERGQSVEIFASEENDISLTPDPGGFANGEDAVFIDARLGDLTDDCRYPLLLDAENITKEPVEAVFEPQANGAAGVEEVIVFEPGRSEHGVCLELPSGDVAEMLHVHQIDGNGGKMMEGDFPLEAVFK